MARKFASTLSVAEISFCRRVEKAGLASYSQAIKACERGERDRIEQWAALLRAAGK